MLLLLRSFLFLVVILQCFATTSGADYQEAAESLSEAVRPRPTWKMAILKRPNEWRTPPAGDSGEQTTTSTEKTWTVGEKWGNPFDKLDSNQLHSLEEILTAVREDSWGYSGTISPTGIDGRQFLNNDDGDPWRAKQQSSPKDVGERKGISMKKPVKNGKVVKESSTDETAPQDDIEKGSHEDDGSGALELNAGQSNAGQKGTINDRFRTGEIVNRRGDTTGDVKIAAREAGKMFLWENGKIEPKRIGEEKGERMIMGSQGEIKEMRERMKVEGLGDLKEIMKGRKKGERMIVGGLGDIKERIRKLEKGISETMEGDKKGEGMTGGLKGINGGMRQQDNVTSDRAKLKQPKGGREVTRKNMKMRERVHVTTTNGEDRVTTHFAYQQQGWLPSWVIKERSRGEGNEMRIGDVVQIETEKEREMKGHKVGSNKDILVL